MTLFLFEPLMRLNQYNYWFYCTTIWTLLQFLNEVNCPAPSLFQPSRSTPNEPLETSALLSSTGMSNLASKLDQIVPKWDKSGIFSDHMAPHKNVEIWSEKFPYLSHSEPIWPNWDAKFDIPGRGLCSLMDIRLDVNLAKLGYIWIFLN